MKTQKEYRANSASPIHRYSGHPGARGTDRVDQLQTPDQLHLFLLPLSDPWTCPMPQCRSNRRPHRRRLRQRRLGGRAS